MNSHSRVRTLLDLGTQEKAQALASLNEFVARPSPATHASLSHWVGEIDDRAALLAGSVWCGIRWAKALGRPKTPTLGAGFAVTHESKPIQYESLPGSIYEETGKWRFEDDVSLWDASTETEHRVAILMYARLGALSLNRLTVKLADSVNWDISLATGAGYLRLDPYGYAPFQSLAGERIVLPDFELKLSAYSRGGIEPIGPMRLVPGDGR